MPCNSSDPTLLTFPLGTDEEGSEVFCDLAKMPHLLVAAKHADKKRLLTQILKQFSKNSPDEVKFYLADSMEEDFSSFSDSPHLLAPIAESDVPRALSSLNWIVLEMEKRFSLFQEAGVRDLPRYNEAKPEEKLYRIVIVLSELAELMIPRREETEIALCRLAQMGRAAGIHLVLATKHPDEKVLSGLIRANVPSRISFGVQTAVESRYILDQKGAETLDQGELLYLPLAAPRPRKIFFKSENQ